MGAKSSAQLVEVFEQLVAREAGAREVGVEFLDDQDALAGWFASALAYTRQLPPKAKVRGKVKRKS